MRRRSAAGSGFEANSWCGELDDILTVVGLLLDLDAERPQIHDHPIPEDRWSIATTRPRAFAAEVSRSPENWESPWEWA